MIIPYSMWTPAMHKVTRKAAWAMLDGVGDNKTHHAEISKLGKAIHHRRAMSAAEERDLPVHPDRPN